MYGLLRKKRAEVAEERLLEGTDLFVVRARLPAAAALGFGAELLSWTSGAATAPLLSFDGFRADATDPFWRPTTEDERKEFGDGVDAADNRPRALLNATRARRGLVSEARTVAKNAEAQKSNQRIRG